MIAKVITHGQSRDEARQRLLEALSECQITGTWTNLLYLEAIARCEGELEW